MPYSKSPFNDQKTRYFLCCYQNDTDQALILRIVRQANSTIEQEISPGEQLLFSAGPGEMVSLYSLQHGEEVLTKVIACDQLRYLLSDDV